MPRRLQAATNLDSEWLEKFYTAAGYEVPNNLVISEKSATGNSSGVVVTAINSNIIKELYKPSDQPADIFVSYARTDNKVVESVYRSLRNKKHNPWMDVYSIKGGENWFRAISKAIDECEIFLAVLSNNSVSRRGVVQKELKKAMDKWEGMLPDDIYILPLRIDDCPIPELLKDLHVIDWDNGKGEKKLLDAIRVGLARRKARG
ncbi:toll/interleukin-1 receptor domain-containing protein [Candidatus Villigracilis affinis]|uniref:toll/interleukin-1 receptor domain-containing protein n=1 Tax=Candidatus Villigracilis affinis TaxID=3140682 RepID=UPI001D58B90C|nr:toll/interleukin-1 receptor domain-containing protein [Anaerolineales bacterium]